MTCPHCSEEVLPDDLFREIKNGMTDEYDRYHFECAFRIIVGSVGHLRRKCRCYGGNEDDPPKLTLRQAAQAALEFHRLLEENKQRNLILLTRGELTEV